MSDSTARHNAHLIGVVLVIASALVFSLAGVLTKMIEADAWTIACWRGLLGGALIVAYVAWSRRDKPLRETFRLGWQGWLLASVGSIASLAFIFAFKLTYIANVAVIYATAPFLAAGLAWWLLKEKFREANGGRRRPLAARRGRGRDGRTWHRPHWRVTWSRSS